MVPSWWYGRHCAKQSSSLQTIMRPDSVHSDWRSIYHLLNYSKQKSFTNYSKQKSNRFSILYVFASQFRTLYVARFHAFRTSHFIQARSSTVSTCHIMWVTDFWIVTKWCFFADNFLLLTVGNRSQPLIFRTVRRNIASTTSTASATYYIGYTFLTCISTSNIKKSIVFKMERNESSTIRQQITGLTDAVVALHAC